MGKHIVKKQKQNFENQERIRQRRLRQNKKYLHQIWEKRNQEMPNIAPSWGDNTKAKNGGIMVLMRKCRSINQIHYGLADDCLRQ